MRNSFRVFLLFEFLGERWRRRFDFSHYRSNHRRPPLRVSKPTSEFDPGSDCVSGQVNFDSLTHVNPVLRCLRQRATKWRQSVAPGMSPGLVLESYPARFSGRQMAALRRFQPFDCSMIFRPSRGSEITRSVSPGLTPGATFCRRSAARCSLDPSLNCCQGLDFYFSQARTTDSKIFI